MIIDGHTKVRCKNAPAAPTTADNDEWDNKPTATTSDVGDDGAADGTTDDPANHDDDHKSMAADDTNIPSAGDDAW